VRIDPTQKKIAAAMTLAVALFVGLGWWPARRDIAALRKQIADTQEQILGAAGKAEDLARLDTRVKTIQREIASTSKVIPTQGELAELIRQLSATIESSQLRDQSISTELTVQGDNYATLPIRVTFTGEAPNAFGFINAVEAMPRLMQITSMEMSTDKNPAQVSAQLELNTYFYTTQEMAR
jgi:Tfp pilus assembly protein PilO